MAAVRRTICPEDIHGLKVFKALQGLIERLHVVGTQRDKAGNRGLHMDQYWSLILPWSVRRSTAHAVRGVAWGAIPARRDARQAERRG